MHYNDYLYLCITVYNDMYSTSWTCAYMYVDYNNYDCLMEEQYYHFHSTIVNLTLSTAGTQ